MPIKPEPSKPKTRAVKRSAKRTKTKEVKSAQLRARMAPNLKYKAEKILSEIGISASQAATMLYRRVIAEHGWPCELRVPNARLQQIIEEVERGENVHEMDDLDSFFKEIERESNEEKKEGRKGA